MTQEERQKHDKQLNDKRNAKHNAKNIVNPENRLYRDLSGLSLENKMDEQRHI